MFVLIGLYSLFGSLLIYLQMRRIYSVFIHANTITQSSYTKKKIKTPVYQVRMELFRCLVGKEDAKCNTTNCVLQLRSKGRRVL